MKRWGSERRPSTSIHIPRDALCKNLIENMHITYYSRKQKYAPDDLRWAGLAGVSCSNTPVGCADKADGYRTGHHR